MVSFSVISSFSPGIVWFHAQWLVGFPAQGLVVFVFRDWLICAGLVSQGQNVFLWLWFHDQSVLLLLALFKLWLWFQGQSVFLSLTLFNLWLWYQGQ